MAEDQGTQLDLNRGHIKPETYENLFADKGTLGKIGSIFGLIVGGGGAGLAHQPNALLEMMNQTLQRDLDAQKSSATNAHNFLSINQEALKNQANIGLTKAETAIKTTALSNMQMNRAGLHKMVTEMQKYPIGSPERAKAEQVLGSLYTAVNSENFNIADRAATASAFLSGQGTGNGAQNDEQAFQNKNRALMLMGPQGEQMAKMNMETHIPGIPGQSSRLITEQSRDRVQAMNVLDAKGKDVLNFVNQHKGTWNPQTRAVAQQKIEEMKNFYNDSIKGGSLTQGRLGWYDEQFAKHPTDILAQLMGSTAKLKEMVSSNATRRDSELKDNLGFSPKQESQSQPQTKSQPQPQREGTYKDGRPVVYINGQWYLKK